MVKNLNNDFDDTWGNMIRDYHRGLDVAEWLIEQGFSHRVTSIGGLPDVAPTDDQRIKIALGQLLGLEYVINKKLERAVLDDEFVWLWGEFQKCYMILDFAMRKHQRRSKGRIEKAPKKKHLQKLWYVAWFDWFINFQKLKGRPHSRRVFHSFFEGVISDIKTGDRAISKDVDQERLQQVLIGFPPNEKNIYTLPTSLSDSKFYGAELHEYRVTAKMKIKSLPPVGIEFYPER